MRSATRPGSPLHDPARRWRVRVLDFDPIRRPSRPIRPVVLVWMSSEPRKWVPQLNAEGVAENDNNDTARQQKAEKQPAYRERCPCDKNNTLAKFAHLTTPLIYTKCKFRLRSTPVASPPWARPFFPSQIRQLGPSRPTTRRPIY